jgi:hypothetical protein
MICTKSGVTPALRTSFKGDALCTKAAGRMTGPVAKAEAWVRVVPANSVAAGKQTDALVAGTREFSKMFCLFHAVFRFVIFLVDSDFGSGSHRPLQQRKGVGYRSEKLCYWH